MEKLSTQSVDQRYIRPFLWYVVPEYFRKFHFLQTIPQEELLLQMNDSSQVQHVECQKIEYRAL